MARGLFFPGRLVCIPATSSCGHRLFVETSELVEKYSGMRVQRNKAVVGKNAFLHEAGVHVSAFLKKRDSCEFSCRSVYAPHAPLTMYVRQIIRVVCAPHHSQCTVCPSDISNMSAWSYLHLPPSPSGIRHSENIVAHEDPKYEKARFVARYQMASSSLGLWNADEIISPELVGRDPNRCVVLGKSSGRAGYRQGESSRL